MKKNKNNIYNVADCTPGSLPGSVKNKKINKKFTILCRSFEAPYLSDKTNRIKIGWEMKEKKQFMWFETNFQAPN